MRRRVGACIAIATATMVAGCASPPSNTTSLTSITECAERFNTFTPEPMAQIKPGATVSLDLGTPATHLDSARAYDLTTQNVLLLMRHGLTSYVPNNQRRVAPALATRWTVTDGGATWTFQLRNDAAWKDGTPITSQDFRRSWLRALAPEMNSRPAEAQMMIIKGALKYHQGAAPATAVGIDATDPHVLIVRLEHPIGWFHEEVALPVFLPVHPKDPLMSTSGRWEATRDADGTVTLRQHPNTIRLTFTGAVRQSAPGFLQRDVRHDTSGYPVELRTFLWLNTSREAFRSASTRRAVAAAAQRAVVQACSVPPITTLGPGQQHHPVGSTVALPDRIVLAADPHDPVTNQIVTQLLADGVRVTLKDRTPESAMDMKHFDGAIVAWRAEFFDDYNWFDLVDCTSNYNLAHWCSTKYRTLLKQAVEEVQPAKRKRLYNQLESMITGARGEYPLVPLYQSRISAPGTSSALGLEPTPLGYLL